MNDLVFMVTSTDLHIGTLLLDFPGHTCDSATSTCTHHDHIQLTWEQTISQDKFEGAPIQLNQEGESQMQNYMQTLTNFCCLSFIRLKLIPL